MSALQINRYAQVPLTVEAFQFTGGAENAKAIVDLLVVNGGEANWRPEWVSFDRNRAITNPETLELERHTILTIGDWVILKPNSLKISGFELKILDSTRFYDQYALADLSLGYGAHTENTMEIVYSAVGSVIKNEKSSRELVMALQKAGILFSERA